MVSLVYSPESRGIAHCDAHGCGPTNFDVSTLHRARSLITGAREARRTNSDTHTNTELSSAESGSHEFDSRMHSVTDTAVSASMALAA